jgi:hypothetical protein
MRFINFYHIIYEGLFFGDLLDETSNINIMSFCFCKYSALCGGAWRLL